MSLNQSLQQKLLQKLSPQQIQLMKLLQVPTAILDERIKEEMEENPALELSEEGHDDSFDEGKDEFAEQPATEEFDADSAEDPYENIDIADYVQDGDDDIADYKMRDENYGDQEEKQVMPYKVETSFYEVLEAQLGMLKLEPDDYRDLVNQVAIAMRERLSTIEHAPTRVAVEAELAPRMIYIVNNDAPGFIGKLGTTLGQAGQVLEADLGGAAELVRNADGVAHQVTPHATDEAHGEVALAGGCVSHPPSPRVMGGHVVGHGSEVRYMFARQRCPPAAGRRSRSTSDWFDGRRAL